MFPVLDKRQYAFIRQLASKKHRLKTKTFLVEGRKIFQEVLHSNYKIETVVATAHFFSEYWDIIHHIDPHIECIQTKAQVLAALGNLQSNRDVIAIVKMAESNLHAVKSKPNNIILALDNIKDPGNLGTITRIADWYDITTVLCSKQTVDLYNPKVLQASMGSFAHIDLHYIDLEQYLYTSSLPIIGTTIEGGISIHDAIWPPKGILVIGNESHGITPSIEKLSHQRITIPRYGQAESLNAAISTAIICDYWKKSLCH